MKRSVSYAVRLVLFVGIWLWLYCLPNEGKSPYFKWILDVFPWYSLIAFGSYCLGKLGYDLLTFNDYPKEIKKLEQVCLICSLPSTLIDLFSGHC